MRRALGSFVSSLVGAALLGAACSETMIDLSTDSSMVGGAGAPPLTSSGGMGGSTPAPPEPSGGSPSEGGSASCAPAIKLRATSSGRCLTRGPEMAIANDTGFDVSLDDCAEDEANLWALQLLGETYEVRNLVTGYNLDVLLASTDDGARVVLYHPHQFFNQRFLFRPRSRFTFEITPRHSESQCVTVRDSHLELWPCDNAVSAQLFEIVPCEAP